MGVKIEDGVAIQFRYKQDAGISYGVIVGVNKDGFDFVPVARLGPFRKCYDDVGASYEIDKDNVRLKHCPPPFQRLCASSSRGVYAYANINNLLSFTKEDCQKYEVCVIDGGQKVPEPDMKEIWNHPWLEQLQKERIRKSVNRVSQLEAKFAEIAMQTDIMDDSDTYSL